MGWKILKWPFDFREGPLTYKSPTPLNVRFLTMLYFSKIITISLHCEEELAKNLTFWGRVNLTLRGKVKLTFNIVRKKWKVFQKHPESRFSILPHNVVLGVRLILPHNALLFEDNDNFAALWGRVSQKSNIVRKS